MGINLNPMLPKRRIQPKPICAQKSTMSEQDKRNEFIRALYCHCRYCDFYFKRAFPGDDICKNPSCVQRYKEEEEELI